jgi:hypothetical protein
VHDWDSAKLDIRAGVEPGCGPVPLRFSVAGALALAGAVAGALALAECDACPKRGFGSLSVALAECDASAAGPSRPG